MSLFEIIMLLCFGAAWPLSIYKSLKTRTVKGKSPLFLLVVFIGYLAGIFHKIIYSLDGVIFFYAFNAVLVLTDLVVYFIISRGRPQSKAGSGTAGI